MGVRELRDGFNAVAAPTFVCQQAFLTYETHDTTQFQRLTFSGIGADGVAFTQKSDLIRPHGDPVAGARATAQGMLDRLAKAKQG